MNTYKLKYRTFDQLIAEVQSDFTMYDSANLIDPGTLIKVATRVNADIGLKINSTKQTVISVEKNRAKLPNDFQTVNFVFIAADYKVKHFPIQGTHVESVQAPVVPKYNPGVNEIDVCATPVINNNTSFIPVLCNVCNQQSCNCNAATCSTELNCDGVEINLIQRLKYSTHEYKKFIPLRIIGDGTFVDENCPNKAFNTHNEAYIKDGYIYTNFKTGKLYINYQGLMEDEEGNLLVLDHPLINEYYEYALKERILENLMFNNESVNGALVQRIDMKLRNARVTALGIVNTPDFSDMRRMWETNRKAMFYKYYKMFQSY